MNYEIMILEFFGNSKVRNLNLNCDFSNLRVVRKSAFCTLNLRYEPKNLKILENSEFSNVHGFA